MLDIRNFDKGATPDAIARLNKMAEVTRQIKQVTSDDFVSVRQLPGQATSHGLNINMLRQRLGRKGTEIQHAFCKENAPIITPLTSVAFTNNGSNGVRATKTGHGLITGIIITVSVSTDYDGDWKITKIDNDHFDLDTAIYVVNRVGTVTRHGDEIICYLDTDGTGKEIVAHCNISGGGDKHLSKSTRNLEDGDRLEIVKIDDEWMALEGFQTRKSCVCTSPP